MNKLKNKYDGMVIFETPILIIDHTYEKHYIYGLLYKKEVMHKNDLWTWEINRYLAYLLGCQKHTEKGGELTSDTWFTSKGKIIPLSPEAKNFIYKLEKTELPKYTIDEVTPIKLSDGDYEGDFLLINPYLNLHSTSQAEGHTKLTDLLPTMADYNELRKKVDGDENIESVDIETDGKGQPNGGRLVSEMFNQQTVLKFDKWVNENFQKFPPQDPDYDDRPKGWRDDDDEEEEE